MSKVDYSFKYIIIGDAYVGKTTLLYKYSKSKFLIDNTLRSTHGVDFYTKTIEYIDEKNKPRYIKLQLFDTAGQERYSSIVSPYFRNSTGVIIMFDCTNKKSFHSVKRWLKQARELCDSKTEIILVGNKSADHLHREVMPDLAESYAKSENLHYFEIEANEDLYINDPFDVLTKLTINRLKEGLITEEHFSTLGIQPRNNKRVFEPNKRKNILGFLKCFGF